MSDRAERDFVVRACHVRRATTEKNCSIYIRGLNYLMRPDVTAGITNAIKYPNGNLASLPLVQASIQGDETIYPDQATRARLIPIRAVSPEYSRLLTREWTRFRTGY